MIIVLSRDLIITSRIAEAAGRAGREVLRIDDPAQLPDREEVERVLVDWGDRQPSWTPGLQAWLGDGRSRRPSQVLLFGPHTDLDAHRAARTAGLGPMLARSKLLADLPDLLGTDDRR